MPNENLPVSGPPPVPAQPAAPPDKRDVAANDAYAQALLKVTAAEYEKKLAAQPNHKKLLTPKRITYLVISTLIGVVVTVLASHFVNKSGGTSGDQGKQLLNSVKTYDDPKAY